MKKTTKSVLSLLLLLTLLFASGCGMGGEFDYSSSNLLKYVDIKLSDFTGLTLEIEGTYPAITREDALRSFREERLFYATSSEKATDTYQNAPGYGDYAYIYYNLSATENGQSVASNLFSEDGAALVLIGYWEFPDLLDDYNPLFDNEAVSNALMSITPAARRYEGNVSEGDVLRVTYQAKRADGTVEAKQSRVRIDTKEPDAYRSRFGEAFFDALLTHAIGEEYTVESERARTDSEGNSSTERVTYTVKIEYVAEETLSRIAVELPEDAFGEDYRDELQALNGTRVYLDVCIDRYQDFAVSELDSDFLINVFEFKTDKTDPNEIVEAAIISMEQKLREEQEAAIKDEAMNVLLAELFGKTDRIKKLPSQPYQEHYDYIVNTTLAAYTEEKKTAEKEGTVFPYASIDAFAPVYLEYSRAEFATLADYAEDTAKQTTENRVCLFAMAQLADCRLTKKEIEELYADYINAILEAYPDMTAQAVVEALGGEEEVLWYVTLKVTNGKLTDYIYENNTWIIDRGQ
jgi:hypothetical protein